MWDRQTGKPIQRAIVWQDRRTAERCATLRADGWEPAVTAATGLILDPYFSATKIGWLLDHVKGARKAADRGDLCFGTIDSFLIWRLTGGRVHATDATNAARTLLFNIHEGRWDDRMCAIFGVPAEMLPEVKDCAASFGVSEKKILGAAIPILGVAGDQQAATIGQACFSPGMLKSTYGTGCFALLNTGDEAVTSRNRLLTTIAYQLDGKRTYALEGSIFIAGAAVQWLRDGLKMVRRADETAALAAAADPEQAVYLVPAFAGLGRRTGTRKRAARSTASPAGRRAPRSRGRRWNRSATRRATCWRRCAVTGRRARGVRTVLRVDGGMVASDWTMQFLADILDAPVDRPKILETTALGAAYLAGLAAGLYPPPRTFAKTWKLDRRFSPKMREPVRAAKYAGWQAAVARTLSR